MSFGEYENDPGWIFLKPSREMVLADLSKPFDSKKNCWIADPEEGFVACDIKSAKGDQVVVMTTKGMNEKTVKKEQIQEMNPPKYEKSEDMANLTFLNEAAVLHNLKQRYYNMMIYTYSGLFCVVINPYKRLPIYSQSIIKMYMGKRRNEMPPHLFATSDEAYRNMVQDRENQSMLITGESGAGKTENTKKVISYFAIVGATQSTKAADGEKKKGGTLEEQIVQTNPVLEAFGNAKTVRNNNSSRFGKFIRTHFNGRGKLAGGDIEHYLLEKSRVIRQAPGERCYHIFYQIMSGYLPGLTDQLGLTNDLRYYHFVSQAELTIDGVNDKEEFQLTEEAFDIMGFEQSEKDNLYKLTAAIMHMGEMKFKQRPRDDQAEIDGTEDAEHACTLFGVDHEKFLTALTKPRVRVGNEWVNKGQNLEQVHWAVGALGKAIYARMFKWLISRCNKTLDASALERKYFIGVLDIAGFEIFDNNSFEQMWINFVNERLQQFFNHHMFVLEQEEYQREGIVWEFIDFGLDLQTCIELIEKPLGIISMLDEECIVPKATDMTFAQKLNDQHLGKHPNFQKAKPPKGKQGEAHFAVVHYAGVVRYNAINWLEKNKDPLNDSAVSVLKATEENSLLNDIWADYQTQEETAEAIKSGAGAGKHKGKSASFMTVSMMYRESLNKLMHMLHQTHPHFIRCIIPNELKQSGVIDSALVLNQLTCNGVLEGIRICRKGFPNRLLYDDFRHRYAVLAAEESKSADDPKLCSEKMLQRLVKEGELEEAEHKVGGTKVFFKAGVLAKLEDLRDDALKRIISGLQSRLRSNLAIQDARRREEQRAGYLILQKNIRLWCSLRSWEWFRLYCRVKPMLTAGKVEEELNALNEKIKELETNLGQEEKWRGDLEDQLTKMRAEKDELFQRLEAEKGGLGNAQQKISQLQSLKTDLERQLNDINSKLSDQEDRNADVVKSKKMVEKELDDLGKKVQELQMTIKKLETEKSSRDAQIRALQDEMTGGDEMLSRLNKERKQQEEMNRKLMDDLDAEGARVNNVNKIKEKLEMHLDDLESALDREKRARQDAEKLKRKAHGDLKVAMESLDELNNYKHDIEQNQKKKEQELHAVSSKLDDEQSLVSKLQKQIKELENRLREVEQDLESERQSRAKVERNRGALQTELEDLSHRLDEASGLTQAQMEMNKKREAELAKLRRDLDASNMNHEETMSSMRKKCNDAVVEMGEQLDQIQKAKTKTEQEKVQLQREVIDLNAAVDKEVKSKTELDKLAKSLELQNVELQSKCDEQTRQLSDFSGLKSRLTRDNADLAQQVEGYESQLNDVNRIKNQLALQLEEAKRATDMEARERQSNSAQLKNVLVENENLRSQMDDDAEGKAEMQRHISKLNADIQQWQAKFETEGLAKLEEIEEVKRKLLDKVGDMQDQLDQSTVKVGSLEKNRTKLLGDLDDAHVEIERVNGYAEALEKRQRNFEQVLEEWKKKCDDVSAELDACQRDNRNLSTEAFKLKAANDELLEGLEGLKRENKNLAQEIKDLTDQLGEGGRSLHELQKMVRRLELEKEELQTALDEAEAALETEEAKVMRAQVEVSQIRQEIEKRIQEKEEEFENTRKNHQRALESMQTSLEAEAKGKQEALRMKKKLESDINELEIALDQANKANADAQKNIRSYIEKVRELQMQVEEEQRVRDELKEQLTNSEKRCAQLQMEKDELMTSLQSADRARRQAEADCHESREQVNELSAQNNNLTAMKRKLEMELQAMNAELEECLTEMKNADERGKKAMTDAARLAEELRQEQEHSIHVERMRKALEGQIKDMQVRLDEAEAAALMGGKKIIQKLEIRIRELEQELEGEQRRHQETDKNLKNRDRRVREVEFQIEEDKKNAERLQDLVDKLQIKLKTYKRQIEDAEELAATNLAKYRQMGMQLDDADERADVAENSLSKIRARHRSAVSLGPPLSTSVSGVFNGPPKTT